MLLRLRFPAVIAAAILRTISGQQCSLCQQGDDYFTTKYFAKVVYNESTVTCWQVNSMLSAEESSSEMCASAKESVFGDCCYKSCSLCGDSLGMRDWLAVDYEGRNSTCGDVISSVYELDDGSDECNTARDTIATECCYEYPQDQCRLCQQGDDYFSTKYDPNVEYGGSTFTCGQVNSMLYAEESSSEMCTSAKESVFGDCCYKSCSLCGDSSGMRDWLAVDYEGSSSTCGEVSSSLYQLEDGSDECNTAQESLAAECCYDNPQHQCSLCQQGYDYFSTKDDVDVEYDGSIVTCGEVARMLYAEESSSKMCTSAKESVFDDCCFESCRLCSDSDLSVSSSVMVTYEDASISCSELDETILYTSAVEEGSEQCSTVQSSYSDACCFEQCRVCNRKENFRLDYEATMEYQSDTIECGNLEGVLRSDAVVEGSNQCSSIQQDLSSACCVQNCTMCVGGSVVPDPTQKIPIPEFDSLTCSEIEESVNLSTSPGTSECSAYQATAGKVCSCPSPPKPNCDICAVDQDLDLLKLIPSSAFSVLTEDLEVEETSCTFVVWTISADLTLCNEYKEQVATYCCVASVTTTSEPGSLPSSPPVPTPETTVPNPTSAPVVPTPETILSDPSSAASVFPRVDRMSISMIAILALGCFLLG